MDICREDAAKGLLDFLSTGFSEGPDGFNICFFASLRAALHLMCLLLRRDPRIILSVFTTIMASYSRSHEISSWNTTKMNQSCILLHARYARRLRRKSGIIATCGFLPPSKHPYYAWEPRPNARIRFSSKGRFHTKRASTKKSRQRKKENARAHPPRLSSIRRSRVEDSWITA